MPNGLNKSDDTVLNRVVEAYQKPLVSIEPFLKEDVAHMEAGKGNDNGIFFRKM